MSLFDSLSKISAQIQRQRHLITSEQDTILVSVQPFIRALGYDLQNLAEVKSEYSADAKSYGGERVDYALLRDGAPMVFIEAKSIDVKLNETHWKQLHNYYNARDARFGVLTNGIEYRFYADLDKSNIMDKQPFMTIDMQDLDKRLLKELEGFTKSGFDLRRILDGAQRQRIARLLKQEMSQPSDAFVRHFAKQVHSGRLTEADVQRYGRLVKEAWDELKGDEIVIDKPPITNGGDIEPNPDPPPKPQMYIPIFGTYEGHRLEAVMLRASLATGFNGASRCIQYNGKLTNAKEAMIAAIRTVDAAFNPGKNQYGLGFWKIIDPADKTERPLYIMSKHVIPDEALRQRVLGIS